MLHTSLRIGRARLLRSKCARLRRCQGTRVPRRGQSWKKHKQVFFGAVRVRVPFDVRAAIGGSLRVDAKIIFFWRGKVRHRVGCCITLTRYMLEHFDRPASEDFSAGRKRATLLEKK